MTAFFRTTTAAALACAALVTVMPPQLVSVAALALDAIEARAELRVAVTGLRRPDGAVIIELYDSAAAWDADEAIMTELVDADADPLEIVFSDLAPGQYAVRLFHDANADGELDTGLMGIPSERYGFSNGARPRFRAARFDEAVFELAPGEARLETIALQGAMD